MTQLNHQPIIVASHERSGTHLLIDLLRRNLPACRATPRFGINPHFWLYLNLDRFARPRQLDPHPRPITPDQATATLRRAERPLIKTHLLPGFDALSPHGKDWADLHLNRAATLYAIRDGRAVMPAFFNHARASDLACPAQFSDFLSYRIDGLTPPERWAHHATTWAAFARANPRVTLVSFDRMVQDASPLIQELAATLETTLDEQPEPRPPRNSSVWAPRLARLTGRLPSSNLHERGPRTPKWHELFTQQDRERFHEHAGEALQQLGFVASSDWVTQPQPAA